MTLMAALTGHAVASLCLTKARHGPVLLLDTRGGERTFAASAKSKGTRVESGRSGHQPVFSVVQTQLMAAVSSNQQMTRCAGMAAFQSLRLDGYQMIVPLHIYLT